LFKKDFDLNGEIKTKTSIFARVAIAIYFCFHVFHSVSASAALLPRAQLDESERYFTESYLRLLNRDYWGASDYLDRALRVNTYLVDYYLLKGLVMNRMGDYAAGREALDYYLEVRPMDSTAPRILFYAIAQQRELRRMLGTSALSVRWQFSQPDFQTEFDLGFFRPFSVRGLGKADAWGSTLSLADTLGNRVIFYRKPAERTSGFLIGNFSVESFPVEGPAATLPMGDDSFYVVTTSGDVHALTVLDADLRTLSPDYRGTVENTVADAAPLSSNAFAVADPVAREAVFYSLTDFENTGSWAPPEDALLFEPVALAAYGPWLAIADRGNGKVYFLDAVNRRDFFSVEIPCPRDVSWSTLGELFVINEDGALFNVLVDFRDRMAEVGDPVESGIENGWTLFNSPGGDVYCLDISASKLWKGTQLPHMNASLGFLSVSGPKVSREQDRESFILDARLSSPFSTYSKRTAPVVYAVWNDRTIPSSAEWVEEPETKPGFLAFHRPAPPGTLSPTLDSLAAESGTDVLIALPAVWTTQRGELTNILVDTSIIFTQDEMDALALFCLNNGLELDLWARAVPSVELIRAAALTGGKVVFSLANPPDLSPPRNKLQIRIPLPQELSSSGYPSRSTLTTYLDVGLIHTRDWIPLWPDLLEE
jgi:tetratricopeptide (TPR) repeat protein